MVAFWIFKNLPRKGKQPIYFLSDDFNPAKINVLALKPSVKNKEHLLESLVPAAIASSNFAIIKFFFLLVELFKDLFNSWDSLNFEISNT